MPSTLGSHLHKLESGACATDSQWFFRGRLCKETRKGRGQLPVASPGWTVTSGLRVRRALRRARRKGATLELCSLLVACALEPWEALSGRGPLGPREVVLEPPGLGPYTRGGIAAGRIAPRGRMRRPGPEVGPSHIGNTPRGTTVRGREDLFAVELALMSARGAIRELRFMTAGVPPRLYLPGRIRMCRGRYTGAPPRFYLPGRIRLVVQGERRILWA